MASPVQQSSSATLPSFYSTQQLTANAAPAPSTYPSTVPTQSSYATGGPYPSSTSPPSTYTTSAYPASAYPTSNYPTSAYPTSVAAPSSFAQGEPIYGYQGAQYGYNEQDVPVTAYDDRSIMTREPSTNIGHRRQQSSVSVNLPNPYPDTQRDIVSDDIPHLLSRCAHTFASCSPCTAQTLLAVRYPHRRTLNYLLHCPPRAQHLSYPPLPLRYSLIIPQMN